MFNDAEYVPKFSTMEVATRFVQEKLLVLWDTVVKVHMPWRWWLSNRLNCVTCSKIVSLLCNRCICESQKNNHMQETKTNDI